MDHFTELLRELRQRDAQERSRADDGYVVPRRPAPRPPAPVFDRPNPMAMKALVSDLAATRAAQRETAELMAASAFARQRNRQREIVTEARGVLMKAACDGSMTALEVAEREGFLHGAVIRLGL